MKRSLPIGLIVLGMVFLLGTAGWYYFDSLVKNPTPLSLPESIVGLPLSARITGAQAAENFVQLHNKNFPITSGAIGFYGNQQAILWVAGTPLDFMAAGMVNSMRERIAEGKSPFKPIAEITRNGRIIYVLEGMGQKHFYFQSGHLVIWLAADPPIADAALEQVLKTYP